MTFFERQFFLKGTAGAACICLLIAFIAQYGYGISPCSLCIYERYVYGLVAGIGLMAFWKPHSFLFPFTGFVLSAGLCLAFYHVGVENHWWTASSACKGTLPSSNNFDDFAAQFMKKPSARCDQANWVIFGISATFWNALFFISFLSYWLLVKFARPFTK